MLATRLSKPASLGWHSHREAQWIHAGACVLTVETESAKWLAFPGEALTIRSHAMHNIDWFGAPNVTTLYLDPAVVTLEGDAPCRLTAVSALLGAATEELCVIGRDEPVSDRTELIARLALEELASSPQPPRRLPLPDGRLRTLCREFLDEPSDERDVDACADAIGMSRRTFTRNFRVKTGLSFVDWRRQARVIKAIELRMDGASSKRIADAVGYDSVQSFHAGVKKAFGITLGEIERLAAG